MLHPSVGLQLWDDVGNGLEQPTTGTEATVFRPLISSLTFPCSRNLIIQGQIHELQTYLPSKSPLSPPYRPTQQLKSQFLQKGLSTDYVSDRWGLAIASFKLVLEFPLGCSAQGGLAQQ